MKLSKGEKITEAITYKVEFTRGEEVAELGEHAPKKTFNLPRQFNMNDEKMMENFYNYAANFMNENGYDTVIIQKETYEEFIYFKDDSQ